jgi:hypothetical protein
MTRSKAIEHLKNIVIYSFQDGYTDEARQAIDMAIKALEEPERKKGKWTIDEELRTCYCSNCLGENAYAYDWNVRRFTDSFCPNCGADMRGESE